MKYAKKNVKLFLRKGFRNLLSGDQCSGVNEFVAKIQ